jgi:hypothetical protein
MIQALWLGKKMLLASWYVIGSACFRSQYQNPRHQLYSWLRRYITFNRSVHWCKQSWSAFWEVEWIRLSVYFSKREIRKRRCVTRFTFVSCAVLLLHSPIVLKLSLSKIVTCMYQSFGSDQDPAFLNIKIRTNLQFKNYIDHRPLKLIYL